MSSRAPGHIAGVVNPPAKVKYQYWTGGKPKDYEDWMAAATEHPAHGGRTGLPGSVQAPKRVPARIPGSGKLPALEDAPGSYVKIKA